MDALTIVSCDCHAGASPEVYRDYLDPAYRDRYDAMLADPESIGRRAAEVIGPRVPSADGDDERAPLIGRWTAERRLGQLDADGVAAEVGGSCGL